MFGIGKGFIVKAFAIAAGLWAFRQFGDRVPSVRGRGGA